MGNNLPELLRKLLKGITWALVLKNLFYIIYLLNFLTIIPANIFEIFKELNPYLKASIYLVEILIFFVIRWYLSISINDLNTSEPIWDEKNGPIESYNPTLPSDQGWDDSSLKNAERGFVSTKKTLNRELNVNFSNKSYWGIWTRVKKSSHNWNRKIKLPFIEINEKKYLILMGLILFFVPFLNLIYNLFFIGYFKFEIKFEYFQDYIKPLIFYCELIQDISNTYEGKLLFSTIESIFPILYYAINYGWKDLFSLK